MWDTCLRHRVLGAASLHGYLKMKIFKGQPAKRTPSAWALL
jgi:hypothetical protein